MASVFPIKAFEDNYIWIIFNEESKKAFCIDPGDADPVLTFIKQNNLELIAILLTHHHHDHVGGVDELLYSLPQIKIYGPENLEFLSMHVVKDNDLINLLDCQLKVIETPGHTATHISFFELNNLWLFCGDTLFSGGCGRVFDGSIEELYYSLKKFIALPETTKVYCAHEYTKQNLRFATLVEPDNQAISEYYLELEAQGSFCSLPSSIGHELKINPFLRVSQLQSYTDTPLSEQSLLDIFKQLREKKDKFL